MTGLLGIRVMFVYDNRVWSPVFLHKWHAGWNYARCLEHGLDMPISTPSQHHGCGFHALSTTYECVYFSYCLIAEVAKALVLVDGAGKTVIHEQGFRSAAMQIVGVVVPNAPWTNTKVITDQIADLMAVPIVREDAANTQVRLSRADYLKGG